MVTTKWQLANAKPFSSRDDEELTSLARELYLQWSGKFTFKQISQIVRYKQYQVNVEYAINDRLDWGPEYNEIDIWIDLLYMVYYRFI
jgi:hypothetical protein